MFVGVAYFYFGFTNAKNLRRQSKINSLPSYYGWWCFACTLIPSICFLLLISVGDEVLFKIFIKDFYPTEINLKAGFNDEINLIKVLNEVDGITFGEPEYWVPSAANAWIRWNEISTMVQTFGVLFLSFFGGFFAFRKIKPAFKARSSVEKIMLWILGLSSTVAILTTIGIVFSVLFESIRFFKLVPPDEFLFGLVWNPQFEGAERAGSEGASPEYGMLPMFVGTFLISFVALIVAVPVGLLSAVY